MIKGCLMASGLINLYILYGKNGKNGKVGNQVIGYSLLNMIWLFTLFGSIYGGAEPILQIVCIAFTIAYPAILSICGIRNRRKMKDMKQEAEKENISVDELVKREIPSSLRSLCEELRGNEVALESLLDNSVKNGTLSKAEAALLLEEYSNN